MSATYKKLNDGSWGVRTEGRCGLASVDQVKTGCKVTVVKRNGYKTHGVQLGRLVETDHDMISIWEIAEGN